MKAKYEVDNAGASLIPLNTGRIWFDNVHISGKISVYSGGRVASSDNLTRLFLWWGRINSQFLFIRIVLSVNYFQDKVGLYFVFVSTDMI